MHPKVKEKLQKDGQEISDKFCSSSSPLSVMFPKAPEQTYIDVYPEQDQPGSSFVDERRHQSDYEAEVTVYRALECLEKNLIVLHSFKYSHYQRCPIRDKKNCNKCANQCKFNVDGECDFLVLGSNFCVIVEVKNMSPVEEGSDSWETEIRALVGTFRKSVKQREKIESLIKSIDQDTTVLQFTAYPNFSESCKGQFQENADFDLNSDELATVIFSEDISSPISEPTNTSDESTSESAIDQILNKKSRFSDWWEKNVTSKLTSSAQLTPDVRNILLAIWCTEKTSYDQSKCSLARTIRDIDEKLKEGRISFETKKGKNRVKNPGVISAPNFIRDYIGVHKLTAQQNSVFNSSEPLLWINGPAGTGKSVLLCGKIIQLVQEDKNNKVVLFIPATVEQNNKDKLYECALDKANVQYELIKYIYERTISEVCKLITECLYQVIIVEISWDADKLTGILSRLYNYHVFIDDIQEVILITSPDKVSTLIDTLLQLSVHHTVRVACDLAQCWLIHTDLSDTLDVIIKKLSDKQLISLSMNLRNTRDISDILYVIRDMFIKSESGSTRRDVLNSALPRQIPGHFIHGPRIIFHILDSIDQLSFVLNDELVKLTSDNTGLKNSDVSVVYDWDVQSLVEDTVNRLCSNTADKITVCNSRSSYSTEWPAVVVVHEVWSWYTGLQYYLPALYLQISRARVYCSVFVYPDRKEGYTERGKRFVLDLVDKFGGRAHFVRH